MHPHAELFRVAPSSICLLVTTFTLAGPLSGQRPRPAHQPSLLPGPLFAVGSSPQSVASADFDGDGERDLAVANIGSNSVAVLLNRMRGSFAAQVSFSAGPGPAAVASADLDGDGDNDLALTNSSSNTVSVLLNQGNGSFGSLAQYPTGSLPLRLAIGDLDGDGDGDLVAVNH